MAFVGKDLFFGATAAAPFLFSYLPSLLLSLALFLEDPILQFFDKDASGQETVGGLAAFFLALDLDAAGEVL